jgi:hypothetical protein
MPSAPALALPSDSPTSVVATGAIVYVFLVEIKDIFSNTLQTCSLVQSLGAVKNNGWWEMRE